MSSVILQPAGNPDARQHYVDTVDNPVSIDRIGDLVDTNDLSIIKNIYSEGAYVWGVTPGQNLINHRKWERIQRGDVCLFSRAGHIFASGVVTYKIHNKNLALDLWKTDDNGNTWEYIFFLDEIVKHNIPYKEFNEVVGYNPNFVIQGFNILDEEKSDKVLQAFDLKSEIYFPGDDNLPTPKRRLWTDTELKVTLDAYLWMLKKENDNSLYSKSDVYTTLVSSLDERTVKSIERRMSNISHVLQKNSLSYNETIKPTLDHVGTGVEKRILSLYNDLTRDDIYIPPAKVEDDAERSVKLNAAITGNKAEGAFKTKALDDWGWEVKDETDSHGLGYDFLCRDADGDEFFVEVKGCKGGIEGIRMTENEWEVAREKGDQYLLIIVSNLDTEPVFDDFMNPYKKFENKVKFYEVISLSVHINKSNLVAEINN
tara:strand:- start:43 stop:1326 length:1284 start_codon:yes stop_codon:yes gene_type:complete